MLLQFCFLGKPIGAQLMSTSFGSKTASSSQGRNKLCRVIRPCHVL